MKTKTVFLGLLLAIITESTGCTQPNPNNPNANADQTHSTEELSQHNSPNDCWIAIGTRVYNVTEFIAKNQNNNFSSECGKQINSGPGTRPFNNDNNQFQSPQDSNRFRNQPPEDFNRTRDFNGPRPPNDSNGQRPDFNGQRPNANQNSLSQYYIGELQQ
jgi:hypothetical protein